jgi:hypothetical protein
MPKNDIQVSLRTNLLFYLLLLLDHLSLLFVLFYNLSLLYSFSSSFLLLFLVLLISALHLLSSPLLL